MLLYKRGRIVGKKIKRYMRLCIKRCIVNVLIHNQYVIIWVLAHNIEQIKSMGFISINLYFVCCLLFVVCCLMCGLWFVC
ncbi:hypothetical protein BBB03_00135 [Candidatus Portiera aleyrodidarum]|nr:hypothetical protein BBB03_00135 [Candidatus Portiera aleyrodidarum]